MLGPGIASIQASASPLSEVFALVRKLGFKVPIDVGEQEPGWRSADDLAADTALLDELLTAQAAFTPDLDRKGQAAYLIGALSGLLARGLVIPFLLAGLLPRTGRSLSAFRFSYESATRRGRTADMLKSEWRILSSSFATDRPEFHDHPKCQTLTDRDGLRESMRLSIESEIEPLISVIHARTHLPSAAMWRLVGDSVAGVFLEAGRQLKCESIAREDALAVLKQHGSPLRNSQMHYFEVVIPDPADPDHTLASRAYRSRGGCCRYYTSKEGSKCSTCVLVAPDEQRRNLELALRRQIGIGTTNAG
ncbi:(2Fe-2S)-binding protein [Fulvimarina sp. MAC8]|uniref:(2Fe-2S)-binding protein n=1 Tax=Fulvimarina sp. MAC8 TaxID=3162874 RepID=UPI0032EF7201